ncbi:MAG TPA: ATP-dependent zinc metalloprotease FtsH [Spirochaetia bacterium]|nr:ATP-dependent zinc metalloprotease FtsH [Spirochaetia bacterium]
MNPDQHKKTQFSIFYVLIALLIILGLQWYLGGGLSNDIPYSDFKKDLADGRVKEVVISPTDIQGVMSAPAGQSTPFHTVRVDDPDLVKQLQDKGVKFTGKAQGSILGNILSWILPLAIMFALWNFFMMRMGSGGPGVLSIGQSKAKLVADTGAKRITFNDVAGIDEAKEELQEVVDFLKTPRRFEDLGGRIPRGILLVGAPGTGKTLLAKAVAGEAGVPFFSISGSEFVEMFVGVGAARVRDLFSQASGKAPCIIFIDELDALGKARGYSPVGGYDEREQTLNQLLTEMDGFDTRKGVIIMGATNRPEILDPALLRPGRFDRQVVVDRPDLIGREAILKVHIKGVKLAGDVDLHVIAQRTPGFVGADLANIVNEAALLAARRSKSEVHMSEFDEAIDRIVAGLEKKKRLISPREKRIVAFHESGHAIVGHSLGSADTIQKISIVPRGIAALGYTIQLPTEDRYLVTKKELEEKLATLLGGRVAEEIFFNDVSTGAQNDLFKATDIARAMVKEYGMSSRMGLTTYERPHNPFLKGDSYFPTEKEYSEKIAAEIDDEVKKILQDAHEAARSILEEKRGKVEELASLLLEKEVVDREEFVRLVDGQEQKKELA